MLNTCAFTGIYGMQFALNCHLLKYQPAYYILSVFGYSLLVQKFPQT